MATGLPALAADSAALRTLLTEVLAALDQGTQDRAGPLMPGHPVDLNHHVVDALGAPLPDTGVGAAAALRDIVHIAAVGAADPADPSCAGHLHCPPLAVAAAADLAATVLNQSLDSWDQGPAATVLETSVVAALAQLVGFDHTAGGSVTTGGTESNLMGLLLARDRAVRRWFGADASADGLPAESVALRIYCSELAHFSVQRAAGLLGLGERAVVAVPVDSRQRLDPRALRDAIEDPATLPMAVVATAGTTDFGSIDPLRTCAATAAEHGAWLHVDAAYGGGALFSARLGPLLDGIAAADSVALDLHKLGWQPAAAGVFLARSATSLDPLARRVAYLNATDDEDAGYPSLLGRSLRTTRRPDVVKIAATLRALGRHGLGALVDRCHDLAQHAAARIVADPSLELAAAPVLTSVVFRYAATDRPDQVNAEIRRNLLRAGQAVVGRTEVGPARAVHLKLTLLNPHATTSDVDGLLAAVVEAGRQEDR